MEKLLSILKQLAGQGSLLGSIPKPIKMGLLYLTVAVGVFAIFKYANLDSGTKTFIIIALILLAIVTTGYYGWKAWKQKQQNQQFGGEISQHSAATPRGVSDPGQRARLDDMRKKFQSGVDAYKSRGKDLYKLPWYVIVGEPGSGKTEAIRHSNVGFPPGMQDEFQGVGGTINMNWWFTNQAVLLDTAGRLMFEEVKPGETNEWREFLMLLKKNRPNCPVNGLFLVVPSDSLIKDSADAIQKKAGKIAQQLDVIQRVLDIRFPVFIVVTKCDKINGFREFFDGLTDPQLQHQMLGWSNPSPLDEPFKPELVGRHLEQVAARLTRRRLGLLRDPVPESSEGRRTDEVDALFALPHSLELLSSRLRRYLETIFIAGEWSAKPLFLRGIYFSSSMREGSALDAELAEAIGVAVDDLPEGKFWERERAYFLRDLFVEKVFREKGLVTRASNTKQMLRGQQLALFGFGFAALAIFLAVAWFAMGSFNKGLKDQGTYWQVVQNAGWDNNNYWKGSLVPVNGDGTFEYRIVNSVTVEGKQMPLGEFHARLRDVVEKPIKGSILAPGLAASYNKESKDAQRIVFEAGVIRPLVDATRQKMKSLPSDGSLLPLGEPAALGALIKLESDILSRGKGTVSPAQAEYFLGSLESFVAGTNVAPDTNLVAVMAWTYSTNSSAMGSWPPRSLSGTPGSGKSLDDNPALYTGLKQFLSSATNDVQRFETELGQILNVSKAAQTYVTREAVILGAAQNGSESGFREAQAKLAEARSALNSEFSKAGNSALFKDGPSLSNAWSVFVREVTTGAGHSLESVQKVNTDAMKENPEKQPFTEIDNRFSKVRAQLKGNVDSLLARGDTNEFQRLDDMCVASRAFSARADFYAKIAMLSAEKPFTGSGLIGSKGVKLEEYLAQNVEPLRNTLPKYAGDLGVNVGRAVDWGVKIATTNLSREYARAYLTEVKNRLDAICGFPLVRSTTRVMNAGDFANAARLLNTINADLASPAFKSVPTDWPEWQQFSDKLKFELDMAGALADADGRTGNCTFTLPKFDPSGGKDAWRDSFHVLKLEVGGVSNDRNQTDTRVNVDKSIGDALLDKKLKLNFYENVDSTTPVAVTTPDWGAVWLVFSYNGAMVNHDPTTWEVFLTSQDPKWKGPVRLVLKFDHKLPNLEKWPNP